LSLEQAKFRGFHRTLIFVAQSNGREAQNLCTVRGGFDDEIKSSG
jgi:hypothetical protein